MKASVVNTAVSNISNVESFIMTSTAAHYATRMTNVTVDAANETMTYTDANTGHKYIVDCTDINMIVYKPTI